jgi:uncharacterized membrane protein YbhN (UPF0104 family)
VTRARPRLTPRLRLALAGAAWLAATALVVLALRAVGWRAALAAVRTARPGWLVGAVLCHAVIIALWAWQTYVLLPRRAAGGVGYAAAFEVQALTATAANTVPAFLGQATGVALLADRAGVGTAAALAVFAQHNLVEGAAKLAMLLAAARVTPLPAPMRRGLAVLAVAVAAFAVALGVAVWAARGRGPSGPAPAAGARPRGPRTLHGLRTLAVGWAASLDALRDPRRLALAFAIALAMKVAEASGWWAVEQAFGVRPRPGSAVLALAATNLASAVPASPGNLGVYEGAAYTAYHTLLGVPRETAFALALAGHACYLLPMVGTGWALLSWRQLARVRRRRATPP